MQTTVNVDIRDRNALRSIVAEDVITYLLSKQWRQIETLGDKAVIFANGDDEIVVPLRRQLGDYAHLMADAIKTLADLEGRSQLAIYKELLLTGK